MKARFAMFVLSLAFCCVAMAGPSDYRVKVTVDKHTDFSALRTYAWTRSLASLDPAFDAYITAAIAPALVRDAGPRRLPSLDPAFDAYITEAIDRELASVGLIRQDSEPADVVVS